MNVQVFKPILNAPNDNLFYNSGWWMGLGAYNITNGIFDDVNKIDSCNVVHQAALGTDLTLKLPLIRPIPTKHLVLSIKIKLSVANSNVYVKYQCDLEFNNGSITTDIDEETIPVLGDTFTYVKAISTESDITRLETTLKIKGIDCFATVYQPKLEYAITYPTQYCPSIYDDIEWGYGNASFQSAKVGDIFNITEYQYKKSLTDVGFFSMTIPPNTPFADEIAEDYYLFVDKKDWLLVQDVKKTETGYYITGTDLKGILATRITLYDVVNDTMGFDSVNGSTEECCKHYVLNNIINPTDTNRIIPLVTLATNQNRGIANDTYMSRFEYLHEVIKKLCENAKIGYKMEADIMNNKIIFDVVDIVDKSIDQQDRNRVVFDENGHNISSYERVKGNSTYKNAFYATKSGGNLESDATTKLCLRDSIVPKGIARKEIHLNVSCESVADIETYAKYQYKDYAKIDSLTIAPADVKGYGVLFDVGDKVTQKIGGEYVNKVIQSAEETYSGNNYNVTISFGDEQPQPLKYLKTMIKNKGV